VLFVIIEGGEGKREGKGGKEGDVRNIGHNLLRDILPPLSKEKRKKGRGKKKKKRRANKNT